MQDNDDDFIYCNGFIEKGDLVYTKRINGKLYAFKVKPEKQKLDKKIMESVCNEVIAFIYGLKYGGQSILHGYDIIELMTQMRDKDA